MKKHLLSLITALLFSIASTFAQDCDHSGTAGNLEWCLKDSTLTICGEEVIPDFMTVTPWNKYKESIHTVIIKTGITTIFDIDNMFTQYKNLTSINVDNGNKTYASEDGVLFNKDKTRLICFPRGKTADTYVVPNGVTTIGVYAFCDCNSLASINIPNSVTTIEHGAFRDCRSLTSINLPSSITTIGSDVFYNCKSLPSITIPEGITKIREGTFWNCFGLTSITIPNGVTTIGNDAFRQCYGLISVIIPSSVTTIGESAFHWCGITSITIPNGVTTIGKSAFANCRTLTSITIPNSVTTIENYAFFDCSNLTSITNLNPVPVEITPNVFKYVNRECTLKVPKSAVSAYQNAKVWKKFTIVGIEN